MQNRMTGGDVVVRTLVSSGVQCAFCVPGESYLAVLEAFRVNADKIRLITSRHESGAAYAACGYARISGKTGVALVSRGPGATNAAIAIHTADQDSIPLVLLIGQVPQSEHGREAFQEINYQSFYGSIARAVLEPRSPDDIHRVMREALVIAQSGRPGPVVVVLPEDVTEATATTYGQGETTELPQSPMIGAVPEQFSETLRNNGRLLVVAGELMRSSTHILERFASRYRAAVVSAFRCQDVMNNLNEHYIGTFGIGRPAYLIDAWNEADAVLLAGTRFDAITSMDFSLPVDDRTILMVHPDARAVSRVDPDLSLVASPAAVLACLSEQTCTLSHDLLSVRETWVEQKKAEAERYLQDCPDAFGPLDITDVVRHVYRRLSRIDHVVTNDAGNFSTWVQRHFRFTIPHSQAAPMSGAMGYAVPSAVGAALARPDARVVGFVGDGGFMMTGQELSTAIQNRLNVTIIVGDNQYYGTILMHQNRYAGSGRHMAVELNSPSFAEIARAYGARSWRVQSNEEFESAFDAAITVEGPSLIHLMTEIRDISAFGSL